MPGPKLPVIAPLSDRIGREIHYLRLSLTERCNFRCTYCMPEEGVPLQPKRALLDFEELERVVRVFASLGVRRLRLTGGEPTVRKDVVVLVARLAAVEGIDSVVMTSNGARFPELAHPLAAAGLGGVNVSLDTIDPSVFKEMTRRDELSRVVAGIDAALAAGLEVKLNAVALRDQNDGEAIATLCRFAWDRGIVPRFIEHMPMSGGTLYRREDHVSAAEIRAELERSFGTKLESSTPLGQAVGPARYWQLAGRPERRVGIISAMSEHFCDTCNRVRLTATGELHSCLAFDDATDLRALIRGGESDDVVREAIRGAMAVKRDGHAFDLSGDGGPRKAMTAIGG